MATSEIRSTEPGRSLAKGLSLPIITPISTGSCGLDNRSTELCIRFHKYTIHTKITRLMPCQEVVTYKYSKYVHGYIYISNVETRRRGILLRTTEAPTHFLFVN